MCHDDLGYNIISLLAWSSSSLREYLACSLPLQHSRGRPPVTCIIPARSGERSHLCNQAPVGLSPASTIDTITPASWSGLTKQWWWLPNQRAAPNAIRMHTGSRQHRRTRSQIARDHPESVPASYQDADAGIRHQHCHHAEEMRAGKAVRLAVPSRASWGLGLHSTSSRVQNNVSSSQNVGIASFPHACLLWFLMRSTGRSLLYCLLMRRFVKRRTSPAATARPRPGSIESLLHFI